MLAELTMRAGSEIGRAAVVVDGPGREAAVGVPGDLQAPEGDAQPEPGVDFPGSLRAGAGPALRRNAAPAPAAAKDRSALGGNPEERQAMRSHPPHGGSRRGHVGDDRTPAARVHVAWRAVRRARNWRCTILSFGFKHGIPVRFRFALRRPVPAEPAFRPGAAAPHRPRPATWSGTWSAPTRLATSSTTR